MARPVSEVGVLMKCVGSYEFDDIKGLALRNMPLLTIHYMPIFRLATSNNSNKW